MGLPILAVYEFSLAPRLPIEPSATWEEESLWCRLVKFSRWNHLNAEDLAHVFGCRILSDRALLDHPPRKLRRRLHHYLAPQTTDIGKAFPPDALKLCPETIAECLRGCRHCYQLGFHSALFQAWFIDRCPIHRCPLVTGCPHCEVSQRYAITTNWRRTGPYCINCGRHFLRFSQRGARREAFLVMSLIQLGLWRQCIEEHFAGWVAGPQRDASASMRLLCAAVKEWSRMYVEPMPSWPTRSGLRRVFTSHGDAVVCEADLFVVATSHYYRARRILRHGQARAIRCADARVLHGKAPSVSIPLQFIDADAFMLWRIVWERRAVLVSPRLKLVKNAIPTGVLIWLAVRPLSLDIHFQPSVVDAFNRELFYTYAHCLKLATWMQHRGGMLVSVDSLCTLLSRRYLRWNF
jgi:hypothetical protein